MLTATVITVLATGFTSYPGFGDRLPVAPPAAATSARIEAVTDKGPIVEMIVKCRNGTAIISYSKIERVYCSPRLACKRDLGAVVGDSCR